MTFGSAGQRGRWQLDRLQRESERRRLAARHAVDVARHRGRLRAAQVSTFGYGAGTVVSAVAASSTGGTTELLWAGAAVVLGVESVVSGRRWARRRRTAPPDSPALPQAVPGPPPRGSSAWPPLRRMDAAVTAVRRLVPALPGELRDAAAPAVAAAVAAQDTGRAQAAAIGAAETAITLAPPAERPALEAVRAGLVGELDGAAAAVEALLASMTRLIGARSGYDARGALSAATAEVVARTSGLHAAALTTGQPPPVP